MAISLHYFKLRGYGEYIRLLFVDQKIDFTDHRINHQGEEWKELKKSMIFGQMPCLKIGNKEFVQTGAIMRHLGRVYGLNGSNEDETTFVDMFFEGVRDIRMKYVRFIYYDDETREQFSKVTLPAMLEKLQKLFETYANGEKFVIGEKISYADYALFEELDVYHTLDSTILDKFPKFKSFHQRMWQRANLKGYLEKRAADKIPINGIAKQ